MTSTNFFQEGGQLKGELISLRNNLDSNEPELRKAAAKRAVSLMRSGENVGVLFADMLRCVKTSDIELKRLVYLYLVTYSIQESEQSIMAVNTFIQDSQDANPLVRALAIRTMSRIRIESVAENLVVPLKKCLKDKDPYVRKTAALSVSKLYDIIPETVENADLFKVLISLLEDSNPLVIANTTAAINEINEKRETPIYKFTSRTISPIINSIPESSEWCQTVLLDAISKYEPEDPQDAAAMIERLVPFLKHSNPAVVIGSFKAIFIFMDYDDRRPQDLFPTIVPPFLSLVSGADPEIQYVVLRTLTLFVKKYPKTLAKEIRMFFCKYNDPSFVKMEKLEIIVDSCTASNVSLVLDELSEYCNEIDVGFVRRSIKAIGQIALKIPSSARRAVDVLVKLVEGKAEYSVEESVVVFSDILRAFPNQFESVIGKICSNVEQLKDPRSRCALVWIFGEYCEIIDHVDVLLDPFLDTFHDEAPQTQLQLLSTVVKVYLHNSEDTQDMLQFILNEATKETVLPDVRNRALIYWRVLSMDLETAKSFVNFPKVQVEHSGTKFTDEVLTELIMNMGKAAGVLHVVPGNFIAHQHRIMDEDDDEDNNFNWKPVQVLNDTPVAVNSLWTPTTYNLQITNKSDKPITNFAIAVNVSGSGFELSQSIKFPQSLEVADTCTVEIPYLFDKAKAKPGASFTQYDFAMRTSAGIAYFRDTLDLGSITVSNDKMKKKDYVDFFQAHNETCQFMLSDVTLADQQTLAQRHIYVVAKKENEICLSFTLSPSKNYIADIEFQGNNYNVTIKGDPFMFGVIQEAGKAALTAGLND